MFASSETEQTSHFDGTHTMSFLRRKKELKHLLLTFYIKRDIEKYKLLSPLLITGQCSNSGRSTIN